MSVPDEGYYRNAPCALSLIYMYMFLLCLGSVFVLTGLIILVLDYKLTAIKIIKCLNHILLQVVSIYGEDEEYVWFNV